MNRLIVIILSFIIIIVAVIVIGYERTFKCYEINPVFSHKSKDQILVTIKNELSLSDSQYNSILDILKRDSGDIKNLSGKN